MKEIFKSRIFSFILGVIITVSIGIGVYALSADQVTYNDTTVDSALDSLYTTQSNTITSLNNQISSLESSLENAYTFSPKVGWTAYNGNGWTLGTTSTNRLNLQANKTYLIEILGGINKPNTNSPTINTTFTNATCTLIDQRIDYNSMKAGDFYPFWYVKLYKCSTTSSTVTITQSTTTSDYNWFYSQAYQLY